MSTDHPHIVYRAGYKYQLASPYTMQTGILPPGGPIETEYVTLWEDGTLWIARGYAWDGASGPTVDTHDSMRGSLVHDALYQLMRLGLLDHDLKGRVDHLFFTILVDDGMPEIRANVWYDGVRMFAGFATRASAERKLMIAPKVCTVA